MAAPWREQAMALLAAAKNHGDLAVKISSLRQAKDILASVDPASAAELFPYIADLQSSPESLVRRCLVELIEELGLKAMEQSLIFMPILLKALKDHNPDVVRQTIVSGTNFFSSVLEGMVLQFHELGRVERWLEEMWGWMGRFKDTVCGIAMEPGSVGTKLLAFKFLETCVLFFTSEMTGSEAAITDGKGQSFNISWLVQGHPILDPAKLSMEANKIVGLLMDLLQLANALHGSLVIAAINCLAIIARKRPLYYSKILSALLGFEPTFDLQKGGHAASIQYSLRTAFLGFLRCTHPYMMESRERLLRALRAMNAGEAADQVLRQVDKLLKNTERTSSDARIVKENSTTVQGLIPGDLTRNKLMVSDGEGHISSDEIPAKRARFNTQGNVLVNGISSKVPIMDNDVTVLTPAEQMIAMIGALLGEGERGAQSLELLISNIHADLMADIVITNMKHLPKGLPPLSSRLGDFTMSSQPGLPTTLSHAAGPSPASLAVPLQSFTPTSQVYATSSSASGITVQSLETQPAPSLSADIKRDPRRDPRRLDPRLVAGPTGEQSISAKSDNNTNDLQSGVDEPSLFGSSLVVPETVKDENLPDAEVLESAGTQLVGAPSCVGNTEIPDEAVGMDTTTEMCAPSSEAVSLVQVIDQDQAPSTSSDASEDGTEIFSTLESDQYSSAVNSEEITQDLPLVPSYVDLSDEGKIVMSKLAMQRVIEAYNEIWATDTGHVRQAIIARLVALNKPNDDIVAMLQEHIVLDYQHQKGHEIVMHVLYYLYTICISGLDDLTCSSAAILYDKFLLAVAKSLRDSFPAADKSFSRLLGEVPYLPESVLKLLEDLCHHEGFCKDTRDGDRITQGLGAVWSLILGRPPVREACLDIALKCAIHLEDDIRAKAIRLVSNKLYLLNYLSDRIEQFATNMLLSVVDQQPTEIEARTEVNETSVSGSQNSEPGGSESDLGKAVHLPLQTTLCVSLAEAQRCMSLFFALCTKKHSLLKFVFEIYGRAPKTVKQAIHRHMPILLRNLGPSYQELLVIISDPPQGSENLLVLVLQILTEEMTPSVDLIRTVKHLYETKLKDPAILIPMLSSLSKDEVLPIFPQLVGLPLEKFQVALARILQGSAHTGPALTPAEVLVAIHNIYPEKDGIALKKITDACSTCFEQRTVFTQHVLAKSLSQLVEQTPLPLLFMRTVIQTVDAFPTLVDFVMELLSKLVHKQIWKMPKLWVGFLKCASQTAPHSFQVLLELPPPQLEGALNKHTNLRVPLANFANQPSIRTSLPRSTLASLGLLSDSQAPRPYLPSPGMQTSEASSVHSATLT